MFGEWKRYKFWCQPCDVVCKGRPGVRTLCPHCGNKMLAMGVVWKPGPKGNRLKHYPEGYRLSVIVHDRTHPWGYYYKTVTIGGSDYQRATDYHANRWIPEGTKLRNRKGRIRSRRNVA